MLVCMRNGAGVLYLVDRLANQSCDQGICIVSAPSDCCDHHIDVREHRHDDHILKPQLGYRRRDESDALTAANKCYLCSYRPHLMKHSWGEFVNSANK
ncbi:hypothetical protein D3C77_425810 [compost metagenome]